MNDTPTPRTDVVSRMPYADGQDWIDLAHELERELTAVTEQRDALAEALREVVKSVDPYEMYKTAKRALER